MDTLTLCPQAAAMQVRLDPFIDSALWIVEGREDVEPGIFLARPADPPAPPHPDPALRPLLTPEIPWTALDCFWWATLIRANSYLADDSFVRPAIAARGPISNYHYVPTTTGSLIPAYWWGTMSDRFVVGINGTSNITQALTFAFTHFLGSQVQIYGGYWDPTFAAAAVTVVNSVQADFVRAGRPPLLIIGHSYGAAAATIAFRGLRNDTPAPFDRVVSFGGPKTATEQSFPLFAGLQYLRFANIGDPVPNLPPPEAVVRASGAGTGTFVYAGGEYVHIGNRLVLYGMRGIQPLPDTSYSFTDWLTVFADFLANGVSAEPHYARAYARLALSFSATFPSYNAADYVDPAALVTINQALAQVGV